MSNNQHNNNHTRGRPFPHINLGTTIQNVFRNINHAFAHNHGSGSGQQAVDHPQNNADDMPSFESLSSVGDTRPTDPSSHPLPSSSISSSSSSVSSGAEMDIPPHSQPNSQRDEDEGSMPDLRSISDSSDESDAGIATANPGSSHQDVQTFAQDRDGAPMDDEEPPPLEPITGTRRARVDDDGDDARDRRHPSERVGGHPPPGDAAPQGENPQQPPRLPAGLFGAMFGFGPPGGNVPGGEAPPEHVQTGEDNANPPPTGNDAIPGHAPRGVPLLTAGFTLTIPLFGPPPGDQTGPGTGPAPGVPGVPGAPGAQPGQGPPPNMFGMDAAAREELFAAFAAFFQEFQAMEEGREDPERAKKLVAGLEVVPLGLVKRLERVGGAPGGHAGDANAEGSSSGCAICWDTLLDGESDNFSNQHSSGGGAPQPPSSGTDTVEGQEAVHTSTDAMDVDASASASHHETGASDPTPPSSEPPKIISLPCAHVFHASCLLPWFTRAKQATCPTCRFNIDPENLTYTPPPRRAFNRAAFAQPGNTVPNPAPAGPQAAPAAPATSTQASDAAVPPVDSAPATTGVPPPPAPATGPAGAMPAGHPFANVPGIPILSIPAIQIPLRPPGAEAPGGGNQGMDMLTIGLDMFVGGLPHEERDANPRDNPTGADGTDNNGAADTGAAGGNGGANPNGLAPDLHSLIEGLLRTTRNIIPQVINAQGGAPGPVPAPGPIPVPGPIPAFPTEGVQPQPQAGPGPVPFPFPFQFPADGALPQPQAGPQPAPFAAGGPRGMPGFPFRPMMFRPTRPMPPRRERKTWTLPPAPGPSLRQRIEQREREQGLRCSDTSCGVGPSDEDPYPEPSASLMKQVSIHALSDAGKEGSDASVCAHAFHPACLVSAERVAGWGGQDKVEPLVEVSCPVCRAVGCVTREEWESGVSAL